MNLPTKLTVFRIFLSIFIISLLLFPFEMVGISIPVVRTKVDIDLKYIIAGIFFIIASITDFLDGYLARKNNQITDLGKMLDAIADKLLIDPILVIFAAEGLINPIIPVVVIFRDIIVDSVKMEVSKSKSVVEAILSGKVKTASLMIGMFLTFIGDVPFIYMNLRIDLLFMYFGTIMATLSMVQYILINKSIIFKKVEN